MQSMNQTRIKKDDIKIKISYNMRLPAQDKNYWINQLQEFASTLNPDKIRAVQYGKQDMRGVPSITLIDHNHCVPRQRHFATSKELLSFVAGYNLALSDFNEFSQF